MYPCLVVRVWVLQISSTWVSETCIMIDITSEWLGMHQLCMHVCVTLYSMSVTSRLGLL